MAKHCSILLVEDDIGVQQVLGHVLESEGNVVVVARDGPEMRAALEADSFDVTIIDVRLPGPENGIGLARQAAERGCAVILITGDHSHAEALARTGHHYLLKPFRIDALLEAAQQITHARCTVRRRSASD